MTGGKPRSFRKCWHAAKPAQLTTEPRLSFLELLPMTISRRQLPLEIRGIKLETRAAGDGKETGLPMIRGTAAVYYSESDKAGTQYRLWSDVFERIRPGAFDKAVGRDDVRALQNHDPRMILGRSVAQTLTLSLEAYGLDYLIDTPDTQAGRDTVIAIQRKDITGSSFAFRVETGGEAWSEEKTAEGVPYYVRDVTAVELFDVGPVTYPAYTATAAGTRSAFPCVATFETRGGDSPAELVEVRKSLDHWIRTNYYEPQARERILKLAQAVASL